MKNMIWVLALLMIPALMLGNVAMSVSENRTYHDKHAPHLLTAQNKSQLGLGALGGTGNSRALLIEDQAPWGVESDEQALTALGVPYDLITSDLLASTDLSQYKFIMYASEQGGNYYSNIMNNIAEITNYVSSGGVLIAHCGSDNWNGAQVFPGENVNTGVLILDSTHYQQIQILDPNNPVAEGLTDDELSNTQNGPTATLWSFGWANPAALGTGVDMVMRAEGSPLYTYFDYNYGSGKVLVTTQSVEWQYAGNGGTTRFLDNEIEYALKYVPTPPEKAIALLIEDKSPFGVESDGRALTVLGVPYNVTASSNLASTNLSKYKFIMYASDQDASYYSNINAQMQKITAYVSAGGVLIAHCGSDNWNEEQILPETANSGQLILDHLHGQNIQITDPNNPVAEGLTNDELSNIQDGTTATLGHFRWANPAGLGTGVDFVMITADENSPPGYYIDYNYGSGKVLATMQSVEWQYAGHGGTTRFLNNEIGYALEYSLHTLPLYVSQVQYNATLAGGPYTPINEGLYINSTSAPAAQYIGYEIGVTAESGDANLVMVTDKLPPGLTYVGTYKDNGHNQPDLTRPINQTTDPELITWPTVTGNLATDTVTVQISSLPIMQCSTPLVGSSGEICYPLRYYEKFWIVTKLNSLTDNPQILYNNLLVRDANSDVNIFKESKLVVQGDYNRFEAAKSYEFLLENQSRLLLGFEDLLHGVTQSQVTGVTVNNTSFLLSFEQLLDQQGDLLDSYQSILYSQPGSSTWYWDGSLTTYTQERQGAIRIDFLLSYEEQLKKEAFLFSSFEDVLKKSWNYGPADPQKKEFGSSFEKLLHKEMGLYGSYVTLTQQLDLNDSQYYVPTYVPASIQKSDGTPYNPAVGLRGLEWRIVFLGSFENMLRLQSDLLSGFGGIVKEMIAPPAPVPAPVPVPTVLPSPHAPVTKTVTTKVSSSNVTVKGSGSGSLANAVARSNKGVAFNALNKTSKHMQPYRRQNS